MDKLIVDPSGCRCTDCLTGVSVPVDFLDSDDKDRMVRDDFVDRTSMNDLDWDAVLLQDIR